MKFINRELSWLDFNYRVLDCAERKFNPLNERFKFLAITSSNLDEFIAVRYASVLDDCIDKDVGAKILSKIFKFMDDQHKVYKKLINNELYKTGLSIVNPNMKKPPKGTLEKLRELFTKSIFPLLTPVHVGSTNEIPNIHSGQTCLVVTIHDEASELLSVVPIDNSLRKIYVVDNNIFFVEDIILLFINKLFVNKEISSKGCFRLIKSANITLNHDQSRFIIDRMNETIMARNFSKPILMQVGAGVPDVVVHALTEIFDINKDHVYKTKTIDYSRFMDPILPQSVGSYPKFTPAQYDVLGSRFSIFSELNGRDILLHHPYDSYDTVIKFIEHAANDKYVVAIKMTLYRVSSDDSPIVNALIKAAENGKSVSALIEIKARFDEERNISLINKLKYSGVNVILGIEELKTHCKMCIVVRNESDGARIYSHIATGNYNEKTAKIYTDLSYMTSKQKIGHDLINVFNIISGVSSPDDKLQRVFYSPINLRSKLEKLIDREIEFARKGKKAGIFIKANSISDERIVDRLYRAADYGVKIQIICRGTCSICKTKNISIKSIVGRFLEHSRIYSFHNNGDNEYFISSADLLTRNLDRRVEIMLSLNESNVLNKLEGIISGLIHDERNSFVMDEDGDFKRVDGDFDSHRWFIDQALSSIQLKIPKKK